jgi:hypothetical protein
MSSPVRDNLPTHLAHEPKQDGRGHPGGYTGQLDQNLVDVSLYLALGLSPRQLTIVGRLVPPGDAGAIWELRDVRTGLRVGLTDSVKVLQYTPTNPALAIAAPDSGPITLICEKPEIYDTDKPALCGTADVTADPSARPRRPAMQCSWGCVFRRPRPSSEVSRNPRPNCRPARRGSIRTIRAIRPAIPDTTPPGIRVRRAATTRKTHDCLLGCLRDT